MLDVKKENLMINELVCEKRQKITVEQDMIVPDTKPDVLSVISTSGTAVVYKKEIQSEKIRIDGTINTYMMYIPDGTEDTVRGLSTNVDFSENIDVPNCKEGMNAITGVFVKSIDGIVINGRKITIKASLEVNIKIYSNKEIEVINDIKNDDNIQMMKKSVNINSLVGMGSTKIYAKDNIQIDAQDDFAEILYSNVILTDNDVKISYNKILTKSEAQINLMYLTEDNKIGNITYKIPVVGFVEIQNVMEDNICDVNYEIKNVIIKPNPRDEHSIYVEIEIGVVSFAYRTKEICVIQDMYSPTQKISFENNSVMMITDKQNILDSVQVKENINLENIGELKLVNVEAVPCILNTNKINTKIMYEAELNTNFIFENSQKQIIIKNAKIPFSYTVQNIENGEKLNDECNMRIKSQDFIIESGGSINCNIVVSVETRLHRNVNVNLVSNVQEDGNRENQDYSLIIYIVQKGDTMWKIAKEFGTTVDEISKVNNFDESAQITCGQKLFICK